MAIRGGPDIIEDGLVLHLDAADTNSYFGSGNTWYDLSGNSYNNTLINGASFNSNNGGNILFDGTNDYAQITSSSQLTNITSVSASCWINVLSAGTSTGYGVFNRYSNTTSLNGWAINAGVSGSTVNFGFSGRESSAAYFSNSTGYDWTLNSWHNVVGTKSGTSWKVYVDGMLEVSNTNGNGTTVFGNNVIYFGGYPQFGSTYRSHFRIGICSVYNRALSDDEILQNYNATKGRFGL